MNVRRQSPAHDAAADQADASERSAEEAFESLITTLVLSNALAMPMEEREALFERILEGEGVSVDRDGDWVEIHLVGKTIASLDLHWLVRRGGLPEAP